LAAFFAGQTPKIKPMEMETIIALATAQTGIEAGNSGMKNIIT
jgi:hypothetical protein